MLQHLNALQVWQRAGVPEACWNMGELPVSSRLACTQGRGGLLSSTDQKAGGRVMPGALPHCHAVQVWEYDKNLLQNDALPLVGAFKYETATYMRALAADEFLPAVVLQGQQLAAALVPAAATLAGPADGGGGGAGRGGPGARRPGSGGSAGAGGGAGAAGPGAPGAGQGQVVVGITRKILRKGSRILQALKGMVGSSPKIYNQVGQVVGRIPVHEGW